MSATDSNRAVVCIRFVRWLTAWAWQREIAKAKDFELARDDKWRYRVALETIIKLSRGMPDEAEEIRVAKAALYPPNKNAT